MTFQIQSILKSVFLNLLMVLTSSISFQLSNVVCLFLDFPLSTLDIVACFAVLIYFLRLLTNIRIPVSILLCQPKSLFLFTICFGFSVYIYILKIYLYMYLFIWKADVQRKKERQKDTKRERLKKTLNRKTCSVGQCCP